MSMIPFDEYNYNGKYYHVISPKVYESQSIANIVFNITHIKKWFKLIDEFPDQPFITIETDGTVTDGDYQEIGKTDKPKHQLYLIKDIYNLEMDGKNYQGVVTLLYPDEY